VFPPQSDVSDVTKGDLNEFTFKLHGHKHAFQASTKAERDGWVVAIESRLADAKASRDGLVGSEGYKNHLKQLGMLLLRPPDLHRWITSRDVRMAKSFAVTATPIGAAKPRSTSRPLKGTDSKVHDGATATDTVASSGSSSDEGKPKHKKDRSQSRKRGGLFGALLGKKEEHDEKKEHDKEEKTVKNEVKQEERLEKEEAKAEKDESKGVIAGGAAPLDAAAIGTFL
jgi:hypothetical protein